MYDIDSPKYIVLEPDTTYSPLFWNEEGAAIGDYDSFSIGDEDMGGWYNFSVVKNEKQM